MMNVDVGQKKWMTREKVWTQVKDFVIFIREASVVFFFEKKKDQAISQKAKRK